MRVRISLSVWLVFIMLIIALFVPVLAAITIGIEAEGGQLSGAATTAEDTNASGGNFVLFGNATTTPANPGTWTNITPPQISANPNNPHDNYGFNSIVIHPSNPSILYMGTNYQGLWKSTNAGNSWSKVNTGTNGSALDAGRLWTLAIDPHNPNILWTTSGYGTGGPWKSTDGGVNWTKYPAGSPTQYDDVYSVAIDPYTPNHILLAWHSPWQNDASSGISESFNGGQTWINHPPPPGQNFSYGNAVWFMNNSSSWLLGTQNAGTWRTVNSGGSWTRIDSSNIVHGANNAMLKHSGVYYLTLENKIIMSTDGGSSWTNISAGSENGNSAIATDGTYLYTTPSFPTLGGLGSKTWYRRAIAGGNWIAMSGTNQCNNYGSGTNCNGPVMTAYDPTSHVAYAVNWLGGVWKLTH